jgi:hypothetical protein
MGKPLPILGPVSCNYIGVHTGRNASNGIRSEFLSLTDRTLCGDELLKSSY